jgi:hypothetical protein
MTFPLPAFGVFPYAAMLARNYLMGRVPNTYTITTLIPSAPRPAKLVVVRAVPGGRTLNQILSYRRLLVWVYDTTEYDAVQNAEYVLGYLFEAMYQKGSGIRETKLSGASPYYNPDPDDPAKTPRGEFTVDVLLRANTQGTIGNLTPPTPSGTPTGYIWVVNEVMGGAVDGINDVFSTAYPYYGDVVMVYVNGIREHYFSLTTSDTIELGYIPPEGTLITVDYLTNEGGS